MWKKLIKWVSPVHSIKDSIDSIKDSISFSKNSIHSFESGPSTYTNDSYRCTKCDTVIYTLKGQPVPEHLRHGCTRL